MTVIDSTSLRTRRAVLVGVLGSVAALVAESLGRPLATRAEDGDVVRVGDDLTASRTTRISTTTGSGIEGVSSDVKGVGVQGRATSAAGTTAGISGQSDSSEGIGIIGYATASSGRTLGVAGQNNSTEGGGVSGQAVSPIGDTIGVIGRSYSVTGTGTLGWSSADATGIVGYSGPVPRPDALTMTGVLGIAAQAGGRGGVFSGKAAQLRLVPETGSHPESGELGDLFLEATGALWFCKGGTTWKQIA